MKGLLKYLSPFAPDQSGAVSVLFELGGITVICDAGGCTGNICGFDEPRWFTRKSALFSAGLRDMDAILGRDDRMVDKLKSASAKLNCPFASLIGTPVPAVIATDYKALKRMAEKRTGLPILAIPCTGTRLYDEGASDAYLALFREFAEAKEGSGNEHYLGVLGMTPLDTSDLAAGRKVQEYFLAQGYDRVMTYGMDSGLEDIRCAGKAEKNLVIAPSGYAVAKYLEKTFDVPFETGYPLLTEAFRRQLHSVKGKKILVLHQQIAANEIRGELSHDNNDVTVATWFSLIPELKQDGDIKLNREDELIRLVEEQNYDLIVGDEMLKRPLKTYEGEFLHIPHFAVSGELIRN